MTHDMSPLILMDPTHPMVVNLAQKCDQAPLIFKKLGELSEEFSKIKALFSTKTKTTEKISDKEEALIPKYPLSALVLRKDG